MLPLSLFWAGSCPSDKVKHITPHPEWHVLNELENKLDKGKCIITKCGLKALRFHVTDRQKCFNPNGFGANVTGNIVQTDSETINVVLTPNFYGSITEEKFSKTIKEGMKYKHYYDEDKGKKAGLPLPFLEEWLAIDPINAQDAILIISIGIDGKLGVSESLDNPLKAKKKKGEIKDFRILETGYAIRRHNEFVKEGKKVFTFIHTAG